MKALLLLAATGVGTLVAVPHLPDMMTVKNEIQTALGSASTHLPQIIQTAQPGQTAQTNPPTSPSQDGSTPDASAPGETPFVAQASPSDVLQTYGQPEHVERSGYGETWYYPVYIIYLSNGYIHRTHRGTSSTASTQNFIPSSPLGRSSVASSALIPHTATQSWRFTSTNSLGSVQLGGSGVERTHYFGPRQITGESTTTGGAFSNTHSGATYHPEGHPENHLEHSASTAGAFYHSSTTSTAPAPHPAVVVHRSAPVTTSTVNRVGN